MTLVSFPGIGLELNINNVAFSVFGFDIYWYAVVIALGFALAWLFVMRNAREFGLDDDGMFWVVLVSVVSAVIGARLYYIVFASDATVESFADIFNLRKGGLAFYGGVIFGVLTAVFACRIWKVKLLPALDVASLGLLIGQGIGRWGNFFNQEAFGVNTTLPWGMISDKTTYYLRMHAVELSEKGMFIDPYAPVHPTFLYESLWCALGFLMLLLYRKRRKFDGELFLMYVAWNGFGRAFIEGLRTDSLYIGNSGLRASQVLAILGAIVAIGIILFMRRKIARAENESYLKPYGHTEEAAEMLAALRAEREQADSTRTKKRASQGANTQEPAASVVEEGELEEKPEVETEETSTESIVSEEEAETAPMEEPGSDDAESDEKAEEGETEAPDEKQEPETEESAPDEDEPETAPMEEPGSDDAEPDEKAEEGETETSDEKQEPESEKTTPDEDEPETVQTEEPDSNDAESDEKAEEGETEAPDEKQEPETEETTPGEDEPETAPTEEPGEETEQTGEAAQEDEDTIQADS